MQAPSDIPAEEAVAQNPVSKDPRYMKYFKMLQYVSFEWDNSFQ